MEIFDSNIKALDHFYENGPIDNIKNEPMFFNADFEFAHTYGGAITRAFLSKLPKDWTFKKNTVFDSRVHMLMPGWYPAIPGYHHDDVPRSTASGQPNYKNPEYHSEHIMGLVNGEICPTRFILGECPMSDITEGELVYRKWHIDCERLIRDGKVHVVDAPSNRLIYFDWQTFHTGVKAVANGWRWFGRISRNTDRVNHITNEIRGQVQVYLEFPMEGW